MKTLEQLKRMAEDAFFAKCIPCSASEKDSWMNGFIIGYLQSQLEILQNVHTNNTTEPE